MANSKQSNKKPTSYGNKKNRKRTLTFLAQAQKHLTPLTNEQLTKLLEHNRCDKPDGLNVKQLVTTVSKFMAFGVVQPCPECGGTLVLGGRGYQCEGVKDEKPCEYKNFNPPANPFEITEELKAVPFFESYQFKKFFQDFDHRDAPGKREDIEGYKATKTENKLMEQYFQGQQIVPEGQWDDFLAALKTPLPSTFRVTGFGRSGKELLKVVQSDHLSRLCDIKVEGREIEPPKCLPWYPDNLAWQLDAHRREIRHVPEMLKLKEFLVTETNCGNISRQEAVSMIPPLVLDVKPHHKVLDMCAAPGSKTAQLIESLHADENQQPPCGVVIANDSDNKRCYLMCHQVKRLQTPCFMVVNHDASQLPGFKVGGEIMKFDRVLADVPCTGDGTLRKNVDIWKKWIPSTAHNLHMLQCRILRRGLEMLESGGRLVYSTCSFNPIEDEAVVANVMANYGGEVELLDVSSELPGLKYVPGKHNWKVMDRAGDWYSSYSELPERLHTQITTSMFPPSPEEAQNLHLERCLRLLPHHQNTGGFFVAVILKREDARDKKKRLKTEAAAEKGPGTEKRKPTIDYDNAPPTKKRFFGHKEDPFLFIEEDTPYLESIRSFYGLENFPVSQLMKRSKEGKDRNLYFVSDTVRDLAKENDQRMKFINMGMKMFSRSESKYCKDCNYRLVQEGIESLYPYMTKRKIPISRDDLLTLLRLENPYINQLSKPAQESLSNLDSDGCIVFVYDPDNPDFEKAEQPRCKVIMTGWKGVITARTFLPFSDVVHYTSLCGEEFKTRAQIKLHKQSVKDEEKDAKGSAQVDPSASPTELSDIDIKDEDKIVKVEDTELDDEDNAEGEDVMDEEQMVKVQATEVDGDKDDQALGSDSVNSRTESNNKEATAEDQENVTENS